MEDAKVTTYTDPLKITPPSDLNDLIQQLHQIFESDRVNIEYVQALMASYKSNPKDWSKYAQYDEHRYTRNLVDTGNGKFNLILLCWNEGQGSSIHDHANAHCFAKVMHGCLDEILFDWPTAEDPELKARSTEHHQLNAVTYISDSIGLHRVENPSYTDKAVSLHLYSPPFSKCSVFDERTGRKSESTVTFWSQYGVRTPWKPSNAAEPPVTCEAENN